MSQKNKQQSKNLPSDQQPYTFTDYLKINAIFWGFLVIVAVAVFITTGAKMDPVMGNVFFFIFAVFGGGFTAVSIFDYFYEKVASREDTGDN